MALLDWLKVVKKMLTPEEELTEEDQANLVAAGYIVSMNPNSSEYLSTTPILCDHFIDWTYVIDLDNIMFTVNNEASFRLDYIPRGSFGDEWIKYLARDSRLSLCCAPWTPEEIRFQIGGKALPDEDAEFMLEYSTLNATIIDSAAWTLDPHSYLANSRKVAVVLADGLITGYYGLLHSFGGPISWSSVLYIIKGLIATAAPSFARLVSIENPSGSGGYQEVNGSNVINWRSIDSSRLELGCFRGCLVCIVADLSTEDHIKCNVAKVVRRIRTRRAHHSSKPSTVILVSVQHVVVVSVSATEVSHSNAQPLLSGYGINRDGGNEGLSLLSYYLRPAVLDVDSNFTGRMPFEIFCRIMDNIDDNETYTSLSLVSKAVRLEWIKRPCVAEHYITRITPDNCRSMYPETQCSCCIVEYLSKDNKLRRAQVVKASE